MKVRMVIVTPQERLYGPYEEITVSDLESRKAEIAGRVKAGQGMTIEEEGNDIFIQPDVLRLSIIHFERRY